MAEEACKAPVSEGGTRHCIRTRRVLSAVVIRVLHDRFAQQADVLVDILVERSRFDAIADLVEAYPLTVFPDAVSMPPENRRFLRPYGNMLFNAFGPRNEYFERAVADAEPVLAWLQRQMRRDVSRRTGSALRSTQGLTQAS